MFIVTGISRGLGYAVVEQLLANNEVVLGIGRSNPFGHKIKMLSCDLSNPEEIESLHFDFGDEEVTLINNAGILGEIGRISAQEESDLVHVMQVNVFAPMALTQKIYSSLDNKSKFTLVNISSGAANRSIPSWGAYCASKAALNRLTENFYLEEQELGNALNVYAVAPGVIDTGMQAQIREAPESEFSSVAKFIQMKNDDDLFSATEAAKRLIKLLGVEYKGNSIYFDLREVEVK